MSWAYDVNGDAKRALSGGALARVWYEAGIWRWRITDASGATLAGGYTDTREAAIRRADEAIRRRAI